MLVKIRNYASWFGPYQLMEKLFFWMMEEDEYGHKTANDRLDAWSDVYANSWIGGLHEKTAQAYMDWYAKHRYKVKLKPYDTWDANSTLAHIIHPMLVQLKEQKHGAPYVDFEDRPKHLVPEGEQDPYGTDEFHFEAWDWVMDEMIFAFKSKTEDWEEQFHTGESDYIHIPLDENNEPLSSGIRFGEKEDPAIKEKVKWYEMKEGPNSTHVWDKEGHIAYQERISRGFRLFGKYYEGLWE